MTLNMIYNKQKLEFEIEQRLLEQLSPELKFKVENYISELNQIRKNQKIRGCPTWLLAVTFFASFLALFLMIIQIYLVCVSIVLFFGFVFVIFIDNYRKYKFKKKIMAISNIHRPFLRGDYTVVFYFNSSQFFIALKPVRKVEKKVDTAMEEIPIFTLGNDEQAKVKDESKKKPPNYMIPVRQENLIEQKEGSEEELYVSKYRIPDQVENGTILMETNEFANLSKRSEASILERKNSQPQ